MEFESFIGIDWSGDKNKFQKGISVAICYPGKNAPKIIKPLEKYWSRDSLINWLTKIITSKKTLVGFDFSFSYPFYDYNSYFPGIRDTAISPMSLWRLIDKINSNEKNYYGGKIWNSKPYNEYYNSPFLRGVNYESRRRLTEIYSKNSAYSPSPTFNCVGPGAVGTGSLAGMRILNFLKEIMNIWPFVDDITSNKSVAVEIFPTYYFRLSNIKPKKKVGYSIKDINISLKYFNSNPVQKTIILGGPDQDDADALISSAAIRFFSSDKQLWYFPNEAKKEGWIFGVRSK